MRPGDSSHAPKGCQGNRAADGPQRQRDAGPNGPRRLGTLAGVDLLFGALAAGVAWLFALLTLAQYRERRRLHQLVWTAGVGLFALGVTAETVAAAQGAWSEGGYRLWYYAGAMQGVAFLGQGTLHLLDRRSWTQRSLELLCVLAVVSAVLVLNAPLDLGRLGRPAEPSGRAFAEIAQAGWASPRAWTIPFNVYGTLWLVGGALYSTLRLWNARRTRAWGTLMIAVAGLMLASTSTLNRFGVVGGESLGRMAGIAVLFLGFVATGLEPSRLPRLPRLPRVQPLVIVAGLGWGLALLGFFRLEPGAWRAFVDAPGLFVVALMLVGLFALVMNKARSRTREWSRSHEAAE